MRLQTLIKNLLNKYDALLVCDIYEDAIGPAGSIGGYWHGLILEMIVIHEDSRCKGIGTKVMKEICKYADEKQYPIYLRPGFKKYTNHRLVRFYKRFGFCLLPKAIVMSRHPKQRKNP